MNRLRAVQGANSPVECLMRTVAHDIAQLNEFGLRRTLVTRQGIGNLQSHGLDGVVPVLKPQAFAQAELMVRPVNGMLNHFGSDGLLVREQRPQQQVAAEMCVQTALEVNVLSVVGELLQEILTQMICFRLLGWNLQRLLARLGREA